MEKWGRGFWLVLAATFAVTATVQAQSARLAPSPSTRHFEVALHARSLRNSARAEQAAWLSLSLPFDKLALPRVAQQPLVPPPAPAATPPPPPAKPPGPPANPPPAAEPPTIVTFRQLRALSDFARRATVVALTVAGAPAERRRLDSLASRARVSALLPELRLRAARNTDQALRWVPTTDDPTRVTQADGAGTVLEASATFRLDRLLFTREELTVERLRLDAAEARLKLEARVQALVLGLFRARELGCSAERDEGTALAGAKLAELFAELDNLSAGWFSDQAPSFGRLIWGFPEAVLGSCHAPEAAAAAVPTNPVASLENSE